MPRLEALDLATPFGAPLWFIATTGSTMDEARSLAAAGSPPGTLLVAGAQTAGRGRLPGRRWQAAPGQALLATLILDPATGALPAFPLRVGLALARACERLAAEWGRPLGVELKWPNDLLVGDRKLGGILCESGPRGLFVGFGINLLAGAFPEELAANATSLAGATGFRPADELAARNRLIECCLSELALLPDESGWKEAIEGRLWRRGRQLTVETGRPGREPALQRRLVGIDGEGFLVVEDEGGGRQSLPSAEIRIR